MSLASLKQILRKAFERFRRTRTPTGSSEKEVKVPTPPPQGPPSGPIPPVTIKEVSTGSSSEASSDEVAKPPANPPPIKPVPTLMKPWDGWEWKLVKDALTGHQRLELVEIDPAPRAWDHFDGLNCAPSDYFIDLEGTRTDHAPDVRPYLAYIGQRVNYDLEGTRTDHAPDVRPYLAYIGQRVNYDLSATFTTLAEQEEYFVQRGKRYLYEAWEMGLGIFMKPRLELLQLNHGPDRTMPWASLARSHLPQVRRRVDGDVGFEKNDETPTLATLKHITGQIILTNIRTPLPPREYLIINPIDNESQWKRMVLRNYQSHANPAMRLNVGTDTAVRTMQLGDVLDKALEGCVTDAWKEYLMSIVDLDA